MPEQWQVIYERIRLRFSGVVGLWVDAIERELDTIEAAPETLGGLTGLFRKFHDLAGSSGTYGMSDVSKCAEDGVVICRRALDRDGALTTPEIQRLRALLEEIHKLLK